MRLTCAVSSYPASWNSFRTPDSWTSPPDSCGCVRVSSGCRIWWNGAGNTCKCIRIWPSFFCGIHGCSRRCPVALSQTFWLLMILNSRSADCLRGGMTNFLFYYYNTNTQTHTHTHTHTREKETLRTRVKTIYAHAHK